MLTYIILCVVTINIDNIYVYASEVEPTCMADVMGILVKCGEMYGVTFQELQSTTKAKDVKKIHPCVWGCTLQRMGFLDNKGQYVLQPGLTYVKNIVKYGEVFTRLEKIAKHCQSVNEITVPEGGEVGCERGALVVTCFLEQVVISERVRTISKR